jgi:hypothetical protein
MSDRRDDDLRDLLDRLERDLDELRDELDASDRRERRAGGRGRRRADGRRPGRSTRAIDPAPLPRPPRFGEFLRFTEEYTIPTVISMLEATIRSLELFGQVLRLADPGRPTELGGDANAVQTRLDDAGRFAADRASDQLSRRLDDLRTALTEANLPEESESRSLIEEIRDLSAEIEARIAESETDGRDRDEDSSRGRRVREDPGGSDSGDEGIRIDVTDESDPGDEGVSADERPAESPDDEDPRIDIESELDSIREEVHGTRRGDTDGESADEGGEVGAEDGREGEDEVDAGGGDGENDGDDSDDADHDAGR